MPNSISSAIYERIVDLNKARPEELQRLNRQLIAFYIEGKTTVIARVNRVKGGNIFYEVIPHMFQERTCPPEKEGIITPVFAAEMATHYEFCDGPNKQNFSAYTLHASNPKSITARHMADEFSFFPEDPDLDALIAAKGLENMPARTLNEIIAINRRIHEKIKLPQNKDLYYECNAPVGKVFAQKRHSCRHLTALGYALMILSGAEASVVATPK